MNSKKRIEELMSDDTGYDTVDNGFPGDVTIKVTRTKPGEGLLRQIVLREAYLVKEMDRLQVKKQAARDKVTGKTKARAYVAKWLSSLTKEELSREAEEQGIDGEVASKEDVLKCMFGEYEVPIYF